MADKQIRGPQANQVVKDESIVRDTRRLGKKFVDWIAKPVNMAVLLVAHAVVAFMVPSVCDIALLSSVGFTAWGMTRREHLPLKLPVQSGLMDANERNPSTGAASMANGIFFLGNELKTGREVWLTNSDCRQHFLVLGTTGAGKALPLDAKVHTPNGWTTMGDLKVGDRVSTPDGGSAPVIGYYPQGELDIYRFTFADGRTAEACPEHLWEIYESDGDTSKSRLMRTREIIEFFETNDRSLNIRLPKAVVKPHSQQDTDPYLVGLSLAAGIDGTSFIPGAYREASIEQRWNLVRGMMDATGEVLDGFLSYSTTSPRLATDFVDLVRSLGGLASVREKEAYAVCDGVRTPGRTCHVVSIRHPEPNLFFTLPQKKALVEKTYQYSDSLKLGIVSIEPVRRAEAACIRVDHPDHLFITDNYVVTHNTEALLGFAANAILWGSGFLFCDGKGDVSLYAKVYALARRFGREDDLLVLNFMTGNKDIGGGDGKVRSNTLNPFATGSSDTMTQMVVGLMDDAGGDGAMWKGRATAMFTGVMRALTWLRDEGIVDLNVAEIRDHLNLKRIVELSDQAKYPEMPQHIRKSIKSYLSSLPGYQEEKGHKQAQTTLDQHGYLEMQFTKILGSLADVYGHIFKTPYGEIDMADVVLNRRILVVMLPALEKASDEIANLGKIVVATLKGMMGGTLGSEIEGGWFGVVEQRPTTSPTPFICILDEVGYYMVDGMDLMSAQARSLGFCLIFAGQDINAMKRNNEKIFGSVQGNTNTKIIMRTEDPDTAELARKAAGKAYVSQVGAFDTKLGEFNKSFSDPNSVNITERERIHDIDLKAQDEGEMHILHKEWLVRAKSFYAAPERSLNPYNLRLRANHFITVAKPDPEEIASQQRLPELVQRLADPSFASQMKTDAANAAMEGGSDEIGALAAVLREIDASKRPKTPIEIACAAMARLMETNQKITADLAGKVRSGNAISAQDLESDIMEESRNDRSARGRQRARVGQSEHMPFEADGFRPGPDDDIDFDDPMDGSGRFEERGRRAAPLRDEERPRPGPSKRPLSRGFTPGRVRKDVPMGVDIDGGELMDMASKIASSDSAMRALAALDFEAATTTKDSVESAIDDALLHGDWDDGMEEPEPFDPALAEKADGVTRSAVAGYVDEFDESDLEDLEDDGGDSGKGSATMDFLSALIDDEEDKQ